MIAAAKAASPAQELLKQLTEDFPANTARWVTRSDVTVMPLRRVPVAMIDLANRKQWNADEHPAKIKRFRDKLRAGEDKPIVLVRRPGHKTLMVADGHHRSIAAYEEGKPPLAWVCIVRQVHGPWDEMHAAQRNSQGGVKLATPAPAQQGDTPQQAQADDDQQLALIVAGVLAASISAEAAMSTLGFYFQQYGILKQAAYESLKTAMGFPPEMAGISGAATRNIAVINRTRRAQFVVASARRLTKVAIQAMSHNESVIQAIAQAVQAERRYYGQQLEAGWNRMKAAAQVDSVASDLGVLLGWRTVLDSHTSPECRAANGKNFRADIMPAIGYPGAVHPHCRCYAGPPWPRARLLP